MDISNPSFYQLDHVMISYEKLIIDCYVNIGDFLTCVEFTDIPPVKVSDQ